MDEILNQVLERNRRETAPFVDIQESNSTLWNQVDALQAKCERLDQELTSYRRRDSENDVAMGTGRGSVVDSAALKAETRLREKMEKLQDELNARMKAHAEEQASAVETAMSLAAMKETNSELEAAIQRHEKEAEKMQKTIDHLQTELEDARSRTKLAEQQYVGLKDSIRILQEENYDLKKENRTLENRLLSEKSKISEEMNTLTDLVESLKKEADMLRTLNEQESKRKSSSSSWFGKLAGGKDDQAGEGKNAKERKFGAFGTMVPSQPKNTVQAHSAEVACVRYDGSNADLAVTGSSDSMVKVWNTSNGTLIATLRSGKANVIIACDLSNGIAIGAGTDKTCRVWNVRTERMVHHLVGHSHKITCARIFQNERAVITGSADRSIKVWDIARRTYKQTVTFRHGSTANSIDVSGDSVTVVSGHLDGGVRFWDISTGERTGDITNLHEGGITSVQFNPNGAPQIVTNGMDSCVKVVDVRFGVALLTMRHPEFHTLYSWASCSFSQNGQYVSAGSSSNGTVFIWETSEGKLRKKLLNHNAGVCGLAWGRGGDSGQQFITGDREGTVIFWA